MGMIINCETGEVTFEQITEQEILINAWDMLRSERNRKLSESDIYVLADRWASYTVEQQSAWSSYRQALRDLPENTTDPFNPVWPIKPE